MAQWTRARIDARFLPKTVADLSPRWASWAGDWRKQAAVACLFVPPGAGESEARVVLTRRTTRVGSHKGQIGFAGGRADPTDFDPVETAIRETTEELGIAPASLEVHGVLPATSSIDGQVVIPVVLTTDVVPENFSISREEVAYVIAAGWPLFKPTLSQSFAFTLFGNRRPSHLFYVGNERIWGLTARILFDANLGD